MKGGRLITVTQQLHKALERANRKETLYRIAKDSGVTWRVVQRFLTGQRAELRSGTIDRLCAYLELELQSKKRRRPKVGRARKRAVKKR